MKLTKSILSKNTVWIISFGLAMLLAGLVSMPASYADGVTIVDYRDASTAQEAVNYLSMMQIIDDTTDFTDNSLITKSEAAELIVRSLDASDLASSMTFADNFYAMFNDIPSAKAFGCAMELGIISGDPAGNYGINDNITYAQAAKMLVCALGYEELANVNGGWYMGYIIQADKVGITKGLSGTTEVISKLDFAQMLRNCFDVKLPQLEWQDGSFGFSLKDNATLEDFYLQSNGWIIGEGIVNANKNVSIMNGFDVDDDMILIEDDIFSSNNTGIESYVGYNVIYVAEDPDKSKNEAIIGFSVANNYCVSLSHFEDCELANNIFVYTDSADGRDKKLSISPSAAYIYNNGLSENIKNSAIDFSELDATFIDNDDDKTIDVVKITESKSYTVRKINADSEKLFLKSGVHKGSASVNLEEDDDKTIIVRNIDGSNADWTKLKEDDAVSIIESDDGAYLEIIVLSEPLKGTVTGYQSGKNATIGEKVYGLAETADNIAIGIMGRYWINEYDEIFLCDYSVGEYVYIVDASYKNSGLDNRLLIKLFDNKIGVSTYECSNSLKINGVKVENNASALNVLPVKHIASVTINSENLVTKIDSVDLYAPSGDRTYCEYAHAFNDSDNVNIPFRFGENTEFYIVPKNGEDEDFGMSVDYEDGDNYTTAAYGFDNITGLVETVVVTVDTDALRDDALSYKSKVGIVNEITIAFDDEQQPAYFVNGFSEGEEFNYISGHYDDVFKVMSTLKKGDVIRFNIGYGNVIMKIEKLASLSSLSDTFHTGRDDEEEKFFGTVMISAENVITNSSKYLYNELYVSSEKNYGDMTLMRVWADRKNLKDEDCQFNDYYIYEGDKKDIRPASMDDIITYEMSASDPSEVFIYRTYSEVKMIVIVE
ncbi:MAG: S-layer homology domain-containing protein [Ruminococcaceae bacterium]|nr:S-layer homology domain-containing protein [Oscillospiraceae bacterium]